MDNSWQAKCSTPWQSLTPPVAAPSQLQPQEPRNQHMNGCSYPHVMQEGNSVSRGMIPEVKVGTPNLCPSYPGSVDSGCSFSSLFSGHPSFLKYDSQQFSIPKPFSSSSKSSVSSSSYTVGAAGFEGAPTERFSQSTQNLKFDSDSRRLIPSLEVPTCSYGSGNSLLDVLQAANLRRQSSEGAGPVNYHSDAGHAKVKEFSGLTDGWLPSTSSDGEKFHNASIQALQKAPSVTYSSLSHLPSASTSGCPRVYCLRTSGDLLLSNTGLLGVQCSCHGLHMSISKFSEHSGSYGVNPGYAVRVDSGETVAQWRKIYLHKFGIRVPGDQNGWDWPEGFSAAGGMVKYSSMTSQLSRNSDLAIVFGQPSNNGTFLTSSCSGQKFVDSVLSVGKDMNAQNGCGFRKGLIGVASQSNLATLSNSPITIGKQTNAQTQSGCGFLSKGLIGASQSNSPTLSNSHIMKVPVGGCPAISKFAAGLGAPVDGCHPISAGLDSILTSQHPCISRDLLNPKTSFNDSDLSRLYNMKEGSIGDKDASCSSFELRLGQPSSQSQTSGSIFPVLRSHLLETRGEPQKSLPPKRPIHNSNFKAVEEHLHHADCPASSSKTGQVRWNLDNNAPAVNHGRDATKLEPLKSDADRSLILTMLLSQFRTPIDTIDSRTTSGLVNGHHVTPSTLLCESRFAKYDPVNSHLGIAITTESGPNICKLHTGKHSDGLCAATEPNTDIHPKSLDTSTNFGGLGKANIRSIAAYDHSSHQHQCSGKLPDECNIRNPLNHSDKVPSLGFIRSMDHLSSGGATVTMGPGTVLPMQTVSTGFVETTISVSNMSPALSKKDSKCIPPYPLDENFRQFGVLGFRDIIEFPNQGHTNTSLGIVKDLGRLHEGSFTCSCSSKEPRHITGITSKQDVSNVAMISLQPGFTCCTGGSGRNISPLTADSNIRCNVSTFSPEKGLHGKNIGVQCQLSHDCHQHVQPSERFVSTENEMSSLDKHGKSREIVHFQGKCDCNVPSNSPKDNSCSKIRNSEARAGSLSCTTSKFIDPKSNENSPIGKEQAISFHEIGNLEREVKKKVDIQAFQWKDVPRKQKGQQTLACNDQLCDVLHREGNSDDHIADAASKCSDRSAQDVVSSECSAPAVTQASVLSNNLDTATVDAGDKFTHSRVVDEESGIGKCCSSDNPTNSERSSEFYGVTCKINPANEGSSKLSLNYASRSLIDELRLRDSLILNKVRKTIHTNLSADQRTTQALTYYGNLKTDKRKRPMKWKLLNGSSPGSSDESGKNIPRHSSSAKGQLWLHPGKRSKVSPCSLGPDSKSRSVIYSTKTLSREIEIDRLYRERERTYVEFQSDADSDVSDIPDNSSRKKLRLDQTAPAMKPIHKLAPSCADNAVNAKVGSPDRMITTTHHVAARRKVGPVVCGEYGVISNGNSSKPVKIFPLANILKAAKRCKVADSEQLKSSSTKDSTKRSSRERSRCIDTVSNFKGKNSSAKDFNSDCSLKETQKSYFSAGKEPDNVPDTLENETNDRQEKDHKATASGLGTQLTPKCKEVRKRSLYELLSVEGKNSSYEDAYAVNSFINSPQRKCKHLSKIYKAEDDKLHKSSALSLKSTEAHQGRHCSTVDVGLFCCVCGSSDDDQMNCLLECGRCLVRVHQACYGVPTVPEGQWYCRPCLNNSKDIVCVLCGYGGGAMTRALRSRNIVKGLLKAWNIITESDPRSQPSAIVTKMDLQKQSDCVKSVSSSCNLEIHNSITAGVHDGNVKQWIHMVCGLWIPGTRCPDVDTMSAFDVSGASSPNPHAVCSICNRPGGTCIQCRVDGCSEQFHPWCGHQKGLLQSEVEGSNNESIGFYGRCQLHATYHQTDSNSDPAAVETGIHGEKECTCARTEVYKGRNPDGLHNCPSQFNSSARCAVSQENLNAWLHINRLIARRKGCPELPISDVERDYRKEYARYKQSKAWKHLVVYKSGIHALGLYTSQFIDRGALVIEYIGEVVGLRVADKRENEYENGRKFQSKSACYFFRIDREHIIDATCKGGIARFVNHSCTPNCVAKVISVKNEKKVVFFAERDIYPGEEITYDYHFNNEDEPKKIPCLCKSKNCRRYLN